MTGRSHTSFRALYFAGEPSPAGYMPLDAASLMLRHGLIREAAGRLVLDAAASLSDRLEDARGLLAGAGLIGPPRREAMPVRTMFDGPVLGVIDRSALRILGLWATKIHVNGLVEDPGGPSIWLSRRAATSTAEPGTFDTLIAGGQSVCETELETAGKEGREEAGLTAAQLVGLRPVRRLPVHYLSGLGFHQELLVIYDLELDAAFEPHCADGEIDQHLRVGLDALNGDAARLPLKHSSRIVCADLVARRHAQRAAIGR